MFSFIVLASDNYFGMNSKRFEPTIFDLIVQPLHSTTDPLLIVVVLSSLVSNPPFGHASLQSPRGHPNLVTVLVDHPYLMVRLWSKSQNQIFQVKGARL